MANKLSTKSERDKDRKLKDGAVVCFDMQNFLTCPRANISSFFYRRKFNVYNLTAHCSLDKQAYCAFWGENVSGMSGNDIASALTKILERIADKHPETKRFIPWSDSCDPQNRNQAMNLAIKEFMKAHPIIEVVEQKFCEPGPSSIQEVDNIHSLIKKCWM